MAQRPAAADWGASARVLVFAPRLAHHAALTPRAIGVGSAPLGGVEVAQVHPILRLEDPGLGHRVILVASEQLFERLCHTISGDESNAGEGGVVVKPL